MAHSLPELHSDIAALAPAGASVRWQHCQMHPPSPIRRKLTVHDDGCVHIAVNMVHGVGGVGVHVVVVVGEEMMLNEKYYDDVDVMPIEMGMRIGSVLTVVDADAGVVHCCV